MQKSFFRALIFVSLFAGCSSAKVAGTSAVPSPVMHQLSAHVGRMNLNNCRESIANMRDYLRGLNTSKIAMDRGLQNHLFHMRLSIKNIFAEGLHSESSKACSQDAKLALSDLRSFEESIGRSQRSRAPASAGEQPSLFTDSHRQLVSNPFRQDTVSSLLDLKTGDILLLHRVAADTVTVVTSGQGPMDWTDIVVVFKDDVDDLYLLTVVGTKVKRRGWYQLGDWLKRSVDRVQVLRPENVKDLAARVGSLQDRRLKNAHSFGDLIKKEYKIKTSTTLVVGAGESVLGEDLEMSPDLAIVSEWKDYSFAYRSRMLTQVLRLIFPAEMQSAALEKTGEDMKNIPQNSYLVDDIITRGVTSH